jgi:NAD(P)-dependent dehydrogenase (short-subunit alcohol dehydrogenase family)
VKQLLNTSGTGKLKDKVAIVTGAGGDIGCAISLQFAAEGAAVVCADLDLKAARRTSEQIENVGGKAVPVECDVADNDAARASVSETVRRFGTLHVLVNNAAHFIRDATISELDETEFNRAFAVNVTGAFLMSRWAIPHMVRAGGGNIIHIASQMGHVAREKQATYCATKGALLLLAKGMALDHASNGIRVNSLSPGGIATQGMADQWGGMERAEREWGKRMHPLGRLGRTEEIARAALFLASDDSSFMTGADLLVDGGYTAR